MTVGWQLSGGSSGWRLGGGGLPLHCDSHQLKGGIAVYEGLKSGNPVCMDVGPHASQWSPMWMPSLTLTLLPSRPSWPSRQVHEISVQAVGNCVGVQAASKVSASLMQVVYACCCIGRDVTLLCGKAEHRTEWI